MSPLAALQSFCGFIEENGHGWLQGRRDMTGRRFLLLTVSVVSLDAALLSTASAETCVTGVNPTFANAVSGITGGQPGTTVVTGVTPTFASAVTGVQTTQTSFLTSAGVAPLTGTAVTGVTAPTSSVTGLQPGATSNLVVPAFDPNANPSNTFFAFANGSNTTHGSGGVELVNTNTPTPNITLTNRRS